MKYQRTVDRSMTPIAVSSPMSYTAMNIKFIFIYVGKGQSTVCFRTVRSFVVVSKSLAIFIAKRKLRIVVVEFNRNVGFKVRRMIPPMTKML